ncbi:hypothetical protein [Undibacterium sp. RuTC16W]|uniref:hypothetical protein n=1 Tax=Undibacterium sp. RuTC16W TaxID=3413048 RepID=UPI003BF0D041
MKIEKTTDSLIKSADKKMGKFIIRLMILFGISGMLFPNNWRQIFGVFGEPIAWCAETIPSIKKIATVSPISELVQGFFGTSFLLIPMLYIVFIRLEVVGLRFSQMKKEKLSKPLSVLIVYFLAIPMSIGLLYVIYALPGDVNLGNTYTRGQSMLKLMISNRITMSLIGAFLIAGVISVLWILTIYIFGPILYLISKPNHDSN